MRDVVIEIIRNDLSPQEQREQIHAMIDYLNDYQLETVHTIVATLTQNNQAHRAALRNVTRRQTERRQRHDTE